MKKMITYREYKDEVRTEKKIRLYYINGSVQNQSAWDELMKVTDAKEDYRMEGVRYGAGLYPSYVKAVFPVPSKKRLVFEQRTPMTITQILEMCKIKLVSAPEISDEKTIIKKEKSSSGKRGREAKPVDPALIEGMKRIASEGKTLKEAEVALSTPYATLYMLAKRESIEFKAGKKGRSAQVKIPISLAA
jgi:hypothetical protein